MKKLMILGAGYSQLPLYETARAMGIYTIAASTPGDWPGFAAADETVYADISSPEAVLQAARRLGIDGVTTCCLDTGVNAAGYVCEELGLTGLSRKAGEICSDKYKMKEAFAAGGVNCARHRRIFSLEELSAALEDFQFPMVLKAVDLMGSRGIFRCDSREEALSRYRDTMAATKKEYCLVEEFIQGTVMGCEAMMKDGELLFCLPDNTETFQSYVLTPVGHSVPYRKQGTLGGEAERQLRLAIRAAGLDNCAVNCDLIEKDGRIYVIEIAGRAGATCLPEIVGLYYGINYYEAIVRLAMGMEVASMFHKEVPRRAILARTLFWEGETGILGRIRNENPAAPDLVDLSFNVEPGAEIRRYENGRDRLGQVILTGETLEDCEKRLREVFSKINIEFIR